MSFKNKTNKPLRKKVIIIIFELLVLIAAILYLLADRYLIEKVEVQAKDSTNSITSTKSTTAPTYDDWNYNSDTVQICVDKIEKGSGSDGILIRNGVLYRDKAARVGAERKISDILYIKE